MNPTFSLLHATWQRPTKAVLAMRQWLDRAARPQDVEYIFAFEDDDLTFHDVMKLVRPPENGKVTYCTGPFRGSAPAWDAAAKASTGLILIQASDDVESPEGWDDKLADKLGGLRWAQPTVIAVSDGYRKDALQTIAICTRARYEQVRHFICQEYTSQFSDDDFTYNAIKDSRAGKCTLIDARDLVFRHEHPCHNSAVPMDATYARGSSPEAWSRGQALFLKRNPEAATDGIRTWK